MKKILFLSFLFLLIYTQSLWAQCSPDIVPPTIACPGTQFIVLLGGCSNTVPNFTSLGTKSDNCTATGSLVTTQSPVAGTVVTGVGIVVITLTVTDAAGNSSSCNFNANKVDVSLPNITCPPTQNLSLGAGCTTTLPNYIGMATTSDNCGVASVTQSPAAGTVLVGGGTTVVSLTATDINGNMKTCSFNVNRNDVPPSITCPGNQSINLTSSCNAVMPNYTGMATASDDCTASLSITQSPAAGSTISGAGAMMVTLSTTDLGGNTSSCSFTLTKVDVTAPNITCPATQSLNLNGSCTAILPSYTALATVSEACGAAPLTQSPVAGTIVSGSGAMTVTFSATDAVGNIGTCSFTVNKLDVTPPSVSCPPVTPTLSLNASCNVGLPSYIGVSNPTDNCSGVLSVVQSPAGGTVLSGVGTTSVTLTATDASGNSQSCSFMVNRVDITNPTITCPANVTVNPNAGACSATGVSLGMPITADNCMVASVSNDAPGTYFSGFTNVTWTVVDVSGNARTCTQIVTVTDTTFPVLSCPANMTVAAASAGVCGAVVNFTPTASDNCILSSLISSPASGSLFPFGVNTVTVTAIDAIGNTSVCTFTITVTTPAGALNVLSTSNLTYFADAECTDVTGWTHYYHTASNTIVLSIQKNGNSIGTIAGGLQVVTATNGNYASNTAQHIAFPVALYPQNPLWYVMNRFWLVNASTQPTSPVKVRFYFTAQDTSDLNGSLSPNTTLLDMKMYKINGLYSPNPDPDNNPATYDGHSGVPIAPTRNGDGYVEYDNGASATGTYWALANYGPHYYAEYEIDRFSGGGGGSGSGTLGALPVEILSFTGKYVLPYNQLLWVTASEENSEYFEVQRWNAATSQYEILGSVEAKGNTQTQQSYGYQDPHPYIGSNIYRLKVVDTDGGYGYSNVINVVAPRAEYFALYPNPTKEEISVELDRGITDEITLTIYDISGKEMLKNSWTLLQNESTHTLSIGNLPQGMYMYKVVYGDRRHEGKVMVVR